MHASTIVSFITFAMVVTATPTGLNTGTVPTCSTSAANKCCNGFSQQTLGGILSTIGLGCVPIVGAVCSSGNAACCNVQQAGLLNFNVCQLAL